MAIKIPRDRHKGRTGRLIDGRREYNPIYQTDILEANSEMLPNSNMLMRSKGVPETFLNIPRVKDIRTSLQGEAVSRQRRCCTSGSYTQLHMQLQTCVEENAKKLKKRRCLTSLGGTLLKSLDGLWSSKNKDREEVGEN